MSLTAEQKAIRATGIGGSEIGVLAGLSKWATPIEIYDRKLGLKPDEQSHHLERGRFLEPGLIEWYAARTSKLVDVPGTMRHPSLARVLATPDALVFADIDQKIEYRPERVLEIKSPGPRTWHEWGEPGTDSVPASYLAQVTWEMACAQASLADVAALIDGDLVIYTVAFDAEFFGELAEIANKFWVDHVAKQSPPPPDGSESYAESLARRFPSVRRPLIEATPDLEADAIAYREARAAAKAAEEKAEQLKQRIQARMGDAGKLVGSFGSIAWSDVKGRESLDAAALKAAHPDIVARFMKRGAGYRSFKPNFKDAL